VETPGGQKFASLEGALLTMVRIFGQVNLEPLANAWYTRFDYPDLCLPRAAAIAAIKSKNQTLEQKAKQIRAEHINFNKSIYARPANCGCKVSRHSKLICGRLGETVSAEHT